MTSTWVLVPCPRARLDELRTLLDGIQHPADRVVVVTTTRDSILEDDLTGRADVLLTVPWDGMKISTWWNAGLEAIAERADGAYEVLCPGSDVTGTPRGVRQLVEALREHDLSMVGPDLHKRLAPGQVTVFGPDAHRDVVNRVPGSCFMLAGEHGLRVDERYRWFYSDDHLEMQARHLKGAAVVGGVELWHTTDHALDEIQQQWAAEDRARFVQDWGRQPW